MCKFKKTIGETAQHRHGKATVWRYSRKNLWGNSTRCHTLRNPSGKVPIRKWVREDPRGSSTRRHMTALGKSHNLEARSQKPSEKPHSISSCLSTTYATHPVLWCFWRSFRLNSLRITYARALWTCNGWLCIGFYEFICMMKSTDSPMNSSVSMICIDLLHTNLYGSAAQACRVRECVVMRKCIRLIWICNLRPQEDSRAFAWLL